MLNMQEHVETLIEWGLTFCEARVYLSLLGLGICPAKTISKATDICQPDVYRVLATLQGRSFVERIIAYPNMFKAVPLEKGLSILLNEKNKEYDMLLVKTELIKEDFQKNKFKLRPQESEPHFIQILGKEAEIEKRRNAIRNAQKSIDVMASWKRCPVGLTLYGEETLDALGRGVKVRYITEKSNNLKSILKYYRLRKRMGRYSLRYVPNSLSAVMSIYDGKGIIIATSPEAFSGETDVLWTNNISILTVMREHFDTMWEKAINYEEKHGEKSIRMSMH